jgi:hypothetical protein
MVGVGSFISITVRWSLLRLHLDLAQILAGIQVPPDETKEFEEFLRNLGYSYVEETENVVYKKYLRR